MRWFLLKMLPYTPDQAKISEAYAIPWDELIDVRIFEYEKNEFICMEGQPFPYLMLFLEGTSKVLFQVENGKSLLLCFYHSGGIIGELELMMDKNLAQTSVQAISSVKCVAIPLAQNRRTLLSNVAFLHFIGAVVARKLHRCTRNSAHIILYPLEARLCSYIGNTNRDGFFREKLTNVAELLGTSYRHLLRALEKLTVKGVLEKRTQGYFVLNPDDLRQIGKGYFEGNPSEL